MEKKIELAGRGEDSIVTMELRHSGFIVRFLARSLDVIVLVAIINILFYIDNLGGNRGWWPPMPIPGGEAAPSASLLDTVNIIRGLFYAGIHPLYYIIMHAMGGQTLGKMAFRIKVVTLKGLDITMGQSILRWLGYLVCDITLGIGYLFIIASRHKQGLHDKIAKTLVIYLH
jgi:uncharacterized RDD family membrane protein YckC